MSSKITKVEVKKVKKVEVRKGEVKPKCEFCEELKGMPQDQMYIHAKCHMHAPLHAELVEDTLILRCYMPECRRIVVTYHVIKQVAV